MQIYHVYDIGVHMGIFTGKKQLSYFFVQGIRASFTNKGVTQK